MAGRSRLPGWTEPTTTLPTFWVFAPLIRSTGAWRRRTSTHRSRRATDWLCWYRRISDAAEEPEVALRIRPPDAIRTRGRLVAKGSQSLGAEGPRAGSLHTLPGLLAGHETPEVIVESDRAAEVRIDTAEEPEITIRIHPAHAVAAGTGEVGRGKSGNRGTGDGLPVICRSARSHRRVLGSNIQWSARTPVFTFCAGVEQRPQAGAAEEMEASIVVGPGEAAEARAWLSGR